VGAESVVVEREDGWWRSGEEEWKMTREMLKLDGGERRRGGRSPHPNNSKRRGGGNAGDTDNLNKAT
jgi:hypothetical protein